MPQLNNVVSITNATTNTNLLSGWQYEYLPFPATVKLIMNTDAASGKMVATIYSGSETIMEASPIASGGTAGTLPAELGTAPIVWQAPAGDRLKISVTNNDASAKSVNFVIYVYPLR